MQLTIDAALSDERDSHRLEQALFMRLPELRLILALPPTDPIPSLLAFVEAYIASVPPTLDLITALGHQHGLHQHAAPLLHIAEDFFIQPPQEIAAEGLEGLLDEAFLAHRLLEEINDHCLRQLGRPMLPVDMTEANTIVHHLIGDGLANRLETIVQLTADRYLRGWPTVARDLAATRVNGNAVNSGELFQAVDAETGRPTVRLRLPGD